MKKLRSVLFSVGNKEKNKYPVQIAFFSTRKPKRLNWQEGAMTWKFKPQKPDADGPVVHDIYSLNCTIHEKDLAILQENHTQYWQDYDFGIAIEELEKVKPAITKDPHDQVLFVLDIKSKIPQHYCYEMNDIIKAAELAFIKFVLKNETHCESTFVSHLLDLNLQYVFLEGSLKADLMTHGIFSEQEREFLQTTVQGTIYFCQMVEFIINAFKRGEHVKLPLASDSDAKYIVLTPEDYIEKIVKDAPDYKSTHKTVTYYPPSYHDMAIKGKYTQAMQNSEIFSCHIEEAENQVVVMKTLKGGI